MLKVGMRMTFEGGEVCYKSKLLNLETQQGNTSIKIHHFFRDPLLTSLINPPVQESMCDWDWELDKQEIWKKILLFSIRRF